MKKIRNYFWIMAAFTACSTDAGAQSDSTLKSNNYKIAPIKKAYWGNDLDALIFSTAFINNNGVRSQGTLRFSGFFNFGLTYNYNFSNKVGIYTGVDVKNIGYIEKFNFQNTTIKQRVYTAGVPVGLRLGNMNKRNYFFLGAGVDFALHYKYKAWSDLQSKIKYNEWFSDRVEPILPYVFAGIAVKGTTLKLQYYPGNFFKTPYSVSPMFTLPVINQYKVNLLLLSIGKDLRYSKKAKL